MTYSSVEGSTPEMRREGPPTQTRHSGSLRRPSTSRFCLAEKPKRSCASPFYSGIKKYLSSSVLDGEKIIRYPNAKTRLRSLFVKDDISYNGCQHTNSGQSSTHFSEHSLISNASNLNSSSRHSFSGHETQLSHLPRRHPRIQVSSLLIDSHARTYHLEVVQHPQKAAEFRNATLSRLPVTPPIIAKLIVRDSSGNSVVPEAELPFLIAHLSLYSEDGERRLDTVPPMSTSSPRILYGNLVSSVDCLEDLQGNMGLFFLFPDASIRWRGRFQLGITLLRISSFSPGSDGVLRLAQQGTILAETRSRPFDVVPHHQYSAAPPTRLTQSFIRQGARMFTHMSRPY